MRKIKYAPILYLKQGEVNAIKNMKTHDGFAPIMITSETEDEGSSGDKYLKSISDVCSVFIHNGDDTNASKSIPIISDITSVAHEASPACFICDADNILKINTNGFIE